MRTALALLAVAGASAGLLPSALEQSAADAPCRPDLRYFRAPGCNLVAADTSAAPDPTGLWGRVECESPRRQRRVDRGGDNAPTATGASQGDRSFRRISVRDGDNYYGERCELGRNNHRPARPTFALAREGDHRAFFFSIRLPKRFPLKGEAWQSVVQLKQSQPSANGSGSPRLGLHASDRRFSLHAAGYPLWAVRAPRNRWVRFVLNVRFSQDPSRGSVRVLIDRNGDGDATDRRERSPRIRMATLKRETPGGTADGIAPGESIPAHLRVGIYHHPSYECPGRAGCVVHFDNIQVANLEDAG